MIEMHLNMRHETYFRSEALLRPRLEHQNNLPSQDFCDSKFRRSEDVNNPTKGFLKTKLIVFSQRNSSKHGAAFWNPVSRRGVQLFAWVGSEALWENNLQHAQSAGRAQLGVTQKNTGDIWEFRTLYQGKQYRLLAFWDKSTPDATLVVATHAFVKKESKVPSKEIDRAMMLRRKYFIEK